MTTKYTGNFFVSIFATVLLASSLGLAAGNKNRNRKFEVQSGENRKIVEAIKSRRSVHFVEGKAMKVVEILPDDTSGSQHQKFLVQVETGDTLLLVYNLDMCERVPVRVGDSVGAGGMFIWTDRGALLHWLHRDPRKNRPDGYVELNGKYYCH